MDNFAIPPKQPLPAEQPGQTPAGLPPKHKIKPEQSKLKTSQISSDTGNNIENLSEEEFQALIEEELPDIPDKPPQCDWHLNAMLSANYPDPFTLPAAHIAKQSIVVDVVDFLHAVAENTKEEPATESASKEDTTAK